MLKDRIFSVYDQRATNVEPLRKARKQFLPRLKDLVKKKKRKTDQDRVWLNFALLLLRFIKKE